MRIKRYLMAFRYKYDKIERNERRNMKMQSEERETKYKKEAKGILATIIEADKYESIHALAPIEEETFEKIIAYAIYDIVEKEIKVFFDVE